MNPKYFHTPPEPASTRVRCPVCHDVVYSRAGIHPQCAVRQANPPKGKSKIVVTVADDLVEPAAVDVDADAEPGTPMTELIAVPGPA